MFYVADFFLHNPQCLLVAAHVVFQHCELVERWFANDGAEAHAVLGQHAVGGGLAKEVAERDEAADLELGPLVAQGVYALLDGHLEHRHKGI